MSIVTFSQTVDIGGGRGRLTPDHAASIRRVDAEVRALVDRDLDVNSAWRDPELQQKLYDAYLHYRKYGAPWAPIALAPSKSVHCKGGAIDTDDYRDPRIVRILNDHGWFQTVYRTVNGKRTLVEPWHFERSRNRDNHRHDPTPTTSKPKPIPAAEPEEEDDDMYKPTVHGRLTGKTEDEWTLGHPNIGADLPAFTGEVTSTNNRKDGNVTVFRGFMVTTDRDVANAWARTHAKGVGNITSSTDRAGYIAIQQQLSRIAAEVVPTE